MLSQQNTPLLSMPVGPTKKPLSAVLICTWDLRSCEDYTSNGDRVINPTLGTDPIALLVYDHDGHFVAQFIKRDINSVPNSLSPSAAPDNSRAQEDYDTYFGTYIVDDIQVTVTQRLIGALSPENVGQVLMRSMIFVGVSSRVA